LNPDPSLDTGRSESVQKYLNNTVLFEQYRIADFDVLKYLSNKHVSTVEIESKLTKNSKMMLLSTYWYSKDTDPGFFKRTV